MKRIKSYISYCLLAAIICMAYSCSGFDEINTVSYTHLDVYKRQQYNR